MDVLTVVFVSHIQKRLLTTTQMKGSESFMIKHEEVRRTGI